MIQNFAASRSTTWAPALTYAYSGGALPLEGAHIAMQLRLYGGAADPALLTLNPIAFVDALTGGTVGGTDEVRTLSLSPIITPAQFATLPHAGEAGDPIAGEVGDPIAFSFDIRITYADGLSEVLSAGLFTVHPGVTTV